MVRVSSPRDTIYYTHLCRDTEDSAPAEFPPEQPEADLVNDDGANYGAEEVELEEGLKAELAAEEAKATNEDEEMAGAEEIAGAKEEDEDSDAGSEDLEAESSGSEDEDGEEEEGDGDEDMEMDEGEAGPSETNGAKEQGMQQQHQPEVVMAH